MLSCLQAKSGADATLMLLSFLKAFILHNFILSMPVGGCVACVHCVHVNTDAHISACMWSSGDGFQEFLRQGFSWFLFCFVFWILLLLLLPTPKLAGLGTSKQFFFLCLLSGHGNGAFYTDSKN